MRRDKPWAKSPFGSFSHPSVKGRGITSEGLKPADVTKIQQYIAITSPRFSWE